MREQIRQIYAAKQFQVTASVRRQALTALMLSGLLAQSVFADHELRGQSVTDSTRVSEINISDLHAAGTEPFPRIGMSMDSVRQLLTGEVLNEELIGGACGMLEVISSDDNSIRIIGVGGVVTAISNKRSGAGTIKNGKAGDGHSITDPAITDDSITEKTAD